MILITRDEAVTALTHVVGRAGRDFVYIKQGPNEDGPLCVYVDPETESASCGVGQALAWIGVSLYVLSQLDRCGGSGIFEDRVLSKLESNGWQLSSGAVDAFRVFQELQDNGFSWGHCLDAVTRDRVR